MTDEKHTLGPLIPEIIEALEKAKYALQAWSMSVGPESNCWDNYDQEALDCTLNVLAKLRMVQGFREKRGSGLR